LFFDLFFVFFLFAVGRVRRSAGGGGLGGGGGGARPEVTRGDKRPITARRRTVRLFAGPDRFVSSRAGVDGP